MKSIPRRIVLCLTLTVALMPGLFAKDSLPSPPFRGRGVGGEGEKVPAKTLSPLTLALSPQKGGEGNEVGAVKGERGTKDNRQTLTGKVQQLNGLLEKLDARLDPDAAATWYALVTDAGKAVPLIKDAGARMFFADARLLNRPMRLTGRFLLNGQFFQVLEVRSLVNGKPHEVYYWCDVCTIKRFENKVCECCGGPMELRETPVTD